MINLNCGDCDAPIIKSQNPQKGTSFYCDSCKIARRKKRARRVELPCTECGEMVTATGVNALTLARKGRAYCGEDCRDAWVSRGSSKRMTRTNLRRRDILSRRMKDHNPMADLKVKERARQTLLRIGHKPPVQGGNGKGPTVPQKLLANVLGWPMEVAIPTHKRRGCGYPTAYKVDVGNPSMKIAIEVDGRSHGLLTRQEQDRKKDAFLRGRGWTVLRFKNRRVLDDLEACLIEIRDAQKAQLNKHHVPYPDGLTKGQASGMLDLKFSQGR